MLLRRSLFSVDSDGGQTEVFFCCFVLLHLQKQEESVRNQWCRFFFDPPLLSRTDLYPSNWALCILTQTRAGVEGRVKGLWPVAVCVCVFVLRWKEQQKLEFRSDRVRYLKAGRAAFSEHRRVQIISHLPRFIRFCQRGGGENDSNKQGNSLLKLAWPLLSTQWFILTLQTARPDLVGAALFSKTGKKQVWTSSIGAVKWIHPLPTVLPDFIYLSNIILDSPGPLWAKLISCNLKWKNMDKSWETQYHTCCFSTLANHMSPTPPSPLS